MTNNNQINEIEPIPVDWQKRTIVLVYNNNNELVQRTYGKTVEELLQDHLRGVCDMWCEYCYQAAMLTQDLHYNI